MKHGDDGIITYRTETPLSPWVTLVAKTLPGSGKGETRVFHSLKQQDYATVLAVTELDEVVLVEQFRPAVECSTLELPGGLVAQGEDPAETAARELVEETGFMSEGDLIRLGILAPDTGRLENRLWCFMAPAVRTLEAWQPEKGVTVRTVPREEFRNAILSGDFDHALHIAIVCLALLSGRF